MDKPKILIVIRGGCLEYVAATGDIEYQVIDHDNLSNVRGDKTDFSNLENVYSPDQILTEKELTQTIEATKIQYKNTEVIEDGIFKTTVFKSGEPSPETIKRVGEIMDDAKKRLYQTPPKEVDITFKDEGDDFWGVIFNTDKAKKVADKYDLENQYGFNGGQFRIDIDSEENKRLFMKICKDEGLTYEEF